MSIRQYLTARKGNVMKKLLTLIMVLAVSSSATYASSFWKDLRNSFRQDVKATKQAIKTDIEKSKIEQEKAQAQEKTTRKREALKEVNTNLYNLNKEMRTVKADKNISETERVIKVRLLQKQIDFCNKQKKDIQKW